jgi:hypothetical protein
MPMRRPIRWRPGTTAPAKKAIVEFVQTTTTQGSPKFVPPAERIATFDPATGLPDTKVGAFSQALHDEAKTKGWTVISMRTD